MCSGAHEMMGVCVGLVDVTPLHRRCGLGVCIRVCVLSMLGVVWVCVCVPVVMVESVVH